MEIITRKEKMTRALLDAATARGFTILGEYVTAIAKVDMICPNGHGMSMSPNGFKSGAGCSICSGKSSSKAKENFKNNSKDRGYLIIGDYVGANKKVRMECPKGHAVEISPSHFSFGKGCKVCSLNRASKDLLNNTGLKERIVKLASNAGSLITGEYTGANNQISVLCGCGAEFSRTPHKLLTSQACVECSRSSSGIKRSNAGKVSFCKSVSDSGYAMVGEYTGAHDKVDLECPNGHITGIAPTHFKNGRRCRNCSTVEQKISYINLVYDGDLPIFAKFGITNMLDRRISEQASATPFDVKNFGSWEFESGDDCRAAELSVKKSLATGVVDRASFPDGFTETIMIKDIERTAEIFISHGGIQAN